MLRLTFAITLLSLLHVAWAGPIMHMPTANSTIVSIAATNVSGIDVQMGANGIESVNITQLVDRNGSVIAGGKIIHGDTNMTSDAVPMVVGLVGHNRKVAVKDDMNTVQREQAAPYNWTPLIIGLLGALAFLIIGGIMLAIFVARRNKSDKWGPINNVPGEIATTAEEDNAAAALTSNMHENKTPHVADSVVVVPLVEPVLTVPVQHAPSVGSSLTCVDNTAAVVSSPVVAVTEQSTIVIPTQKSQEQVMLEQSSPSSGSPLIDQDEVATIETKVVTIDEPTSSTSLVTCVLNDPAVSANLNTMLHNHALAM